MFSDTHFHLPKTAEFNEGFDVTEMFRQMFENKCFFGLDIGTDAFDLNERLEFVKNIEKNLTADETVKLRELLCFTCGLWPSVESIVNREKFLVEIENQIQKFSGQNEYRLAAIGECGIDHHWNPSGVDGRCESDFDEKIYEGEKELFLKQLKLAEKMSLPVIVHSRDGFEETLECIKKSGYNNGIIHCFSYGLKEAEKFLDEGWYISFSGSITYTKKSKMEEMKQLLNFVPDDRILMETDAPYLAPVPCRGKPNNPLLVRHTYEFAAEKKGIAVEALCEMVDANVKKLFFSK